MSSNTEHLADLRNTNNNNVFTTTTTTTTTNNNNNNNYSSNNSNNINNNNKIVIIRARILMTSSIFPCEIDDAIQYIYLGYGAQAPKIVILE